jgi:hypothetical protein
MRAVMTAHLDGGDVETAQQRVTALSATLKPYGNPPALKALLARMADFPRISSRFPLVDLTDEQADALWAGTELEFVIMVIAVSCVKLLSAHNSTQHTSRKHKV